jgi:hypothetical protein
MVDLATDGPESADSLVLATLKIPVHPGVPACPLLAGSGSRPPPEIPVASAPAGRIIQHQNRWTALDGGKVKVDQRLQVGRPVGFAISPSPPQRHFDHPRWRPCLRGTHTRRRADRRFVLATFHAGLAPAPRVRRDARGWRAGHWRQGMVSQTRSARKMPGLGLDRDAQASERILT